MPNVVTATPLKKGNSRVFLIENRAGPTHVPQFLSFAMAGAFEQPLGDVTRIEVPSPNQYGQYEVADEFQGAIENATLPLTMQSQFAISALYDVSRRRCPYDIQVHIGDCEDPSDFDKGWKLILFLESARSSTYKTDDLGSLTSGDEDKVTEEVDTSSRTAYFGAWMSFVKRGEASVTSSIVAISVCDKPNCGECGSASNGCEIVLAVSDPAGSSPGLKPEVFYTQDGYTTIGQRTITSFDIGENPDDATCVGSDFVVVSSDSLSMHIADKDDILDAAETWQEVATGFVAAKGPVAIVSVSPSKTWIAGQGGYIYFTGSPRNGVSVQDAGVATTQDLNAIDALNARYVVAVGDSNAVIYTENGQDWSSVTGPSVGVNLLSIALRSDSEWWVGTADGKLYYTLDKGAHWYENAFNGSGSGEVKKIVWASDSVGFVAHNTGTEGRLLRTVSGGNSWYVLPEGTTGTVPANAAINDLAVCLQEVNMLYAGGAATGGVDGVIIKGSPASVSV